MNLRVMMTMSNGEGAAGRQRRVGSVTMGLSLIVIGVLTLIGMFMPDFDFLFMAKLSPFIFISLGVEVLAAYFSKEKCEIKYDFMSGLTCFILIGFAIFISGCVLFMEQYMHFYY